MIAVVAGVLAALLEFVCSSARVCCCVRRSQREDGGV